MEGLARALRRCCWWSLQFVYALCVLALLLLPAQRYEWLRELEPAWQGKLPEDGSGNRWVAVAMLVAVALGAQWISAWSAATPGRRWVALALSAAPAALAAWRFGVP